MKENEWLGMSDGHKVYYKHWYDEKFAPIAVLQIAHGMAEHIGRYQEFAEFLLNKGIFVVGNDHRGHGRTGGNSGTPGFFAEEYGFERVVDDLEEINHFIHQQYPDTPVFMFGHSMGSFLVRRFAQRYQGMLAGVIISGTGGSLGLLGKVGKLIAKSQMRMRGKRSESPLMDRLSFGKYNKQFPDTDTNFDWLTRDRNEVQKYVDDPYCGFIGTSGFFYDLLSGIEIIHENNELKHIEKDLPFLFISGDLDPVGNNSKGVRKVMKQYQKSGIRNITHIFYKDGRHEMLHELNRVQVMMDIEEWMKKILY